MLLPDTTTDTTTAATGRTVDTAVAPSTEDAAGAPGATTSAAVDAAPVARRGLLLVGAAAAAVAGGVHLGVAPDHAGAWPAEAVAFVTVGLAQLGTAVALLRRPTAAVRATAAAVAAFAVTAWAVTRTVGWPFGPFAGLVEPVAAVDLVAGLAGAVTLAATLGTLRGGRRHGAPRALGTIVSLTAVLALGVPAGGAAFAFHEHAADDPFHAHGPQLQADQDADGVDLRRDADSVTDGQPIAVGAGPVALAEGHGAVWVANGRDGTVSRIDAASGLPMGAPIPVAEGVTALAVGPDAVWVVSSTAGTLHRIDPTTSTVTAVVEIGTLARDVAVGDDGTVYAVSANEGTLVAVDPTDLSTRSVLTDQVHTGPFNGPGPTSLAVDGGVVWVVNTLGRELVRFDATTLELLGTPVPTEGGATDVLVTPSAIVVASTTAGSLTLHDPADGRRLGTPIVVDDRPQFGGGPAALAFHDGAVWVLNNDERTVARVDLLTGTPSRPLFLANVHADVARAAGLLSTDAGLWATDEEADRIVLLPQATLDAVPTDADR